jgi:hypothetical protein
MDMVKTTLEVGDTVGWVVAATSGLACENVVSEVNKLIGGAGPLGDGEVLVAGVRDTGAGVELPS